MEKQTADSRNNPQIAQNGKWKAVGTKPFSGRRLSAPAQQIFDESGGKPPFPTTSI
jgi:hypothetical protein